ncbi:COPII coated assembly protein SEC16 [Histoplasma capsulatum]|uniref:Protein transport protein sec16 n=1 Tax=Ajellomyces capsulatus TaxID=5037 RepID=A0A8A1MEZ3_AJECA|nr:COPII coated assembly protein SEC16 [Histoplasma capsulatum]
MAQDLVFERRGGLESKMIQLGSWNPALRPDNSPQQDSLLSLADSNSTPLPAKLSTTPSKNLHKPMLQPTLSTTGDSPSTATHAELSPGPSDGVLQGTWDNDMQTAHSSSQAEPEESPNDISNNDISAKVHKPIQPFQAESPSAERGASNKPTASEGLPWGDGADASPAWDISPSTTDQFNGLGMADQIDPFPPVDDSHNLESHENGYPEITHAAHNPESSNTLSSTEGNLYPRSNEQTDFSPWGATSVDEDPSGEFFNQLNTQTKPIYTPLEAESKFEEDMLMNNIESSYPTDNNQVDSIEAIFKEDESVDETGFFVSESDIPPFNCKSTSQVPDSQHLEHVQTMDASTNDEVNDSRVNEVLSAEKEVREEDLAERWKAVLDDDDLLIDDDLDEQKTIQGSLPNGASEDSLANYASEPVQASHLPTQQPPRANPYTPYQPSSSDLMSSFPGCDYGLHNADVTVSPFAIHAQQYSGDSNPNMPESFSNQTKAGYQSPYDLPMEITRPKHRASQQTVLQPLSTTNTSIQPPPRKSSMTAARPSSSSSAYTPLQPTPPPLSRRETERAPSSNFFAELPTVSRSRPSTASKYAPLQTGTQPTPPPSNFIPPNAIRTPNSGPETSDQFQLQKPERLDPYSSLPVPPGPTVSGPSAHYSPRPRTLHPGSKPPSSPRYSPAPPASSRTPSGKYASQPPTSYAASNVVPFQPRTSSPLAQQENISSSYTHPAHPAEFPPTPFPSNVFRQPPDQTLPPATSTSFYSQSPPASVQHQQFPEQRPKPPRRSQTQSPSRLQYQPILSSVPEPFQRPASVHGPGSSLQPHANQAATERPSTALDFIYPTDGQELDPLQRWKGAPIFKFGFGGIIASSFPQHTPRYATGQLVPKIKPSPGETKVRPLSDVFPPGEPSAKFPGPLRAKSKKKEVLSWLSSMISKFENDGTSLATVSPQQHNEKILLWKTMRVMVEHDGVLAGNPDVENSVRSILSPLPEITPAPSESLGFHPQLSSVYESVSGEAQPEPKNVGAMEAIRKSLLTGERERAVWEAVDRRLWGHAMLISSTLEKSVWKQVMQEFIRREIKAVGNNTEPMATLYEIFAGNLEESVDELVPPSARAGLQMVSKIGGAGHVKNALSGLEKWQETLCLILSNRSPEDNVALLALSRLLSAYGRIEASHICALFAKSASVPLLFSGPGDPQSQIVLLGTDHRRYPFTFANDPNCILLTEVYEFALSVLSGSLTSIAPHLQAFKLQYALSLAENGNKTEAQQYCDAIGAILKSTTKPSPYYNQRFLSELDELANRLKQSPAGGSSSWMSKPSMEKVSGSILAKFNSFVAGDDSDGGSTGSGRAGDADVGPFAKMVGTPPISRSPSLHDTYAAFGSGQHMPTMHPTSRYAPANQYAPYSPDQHRGRGSVDSQRSPPSTGHSYSQGRASQELNKGIESPYHPNASHHVYSPPSVQGMGSTPPQQHTYTQLAPVEEIWPSQGPEHASSEGPIHFGGYQPTFNQKSSMEEEAGSLTTQKTTYEPPSYEPGPADTDELDKEKPKQSFMDDDDDDFGPRNEAVRKAEKERKDHEANEAFKKAAEEDAKKQVAEKKGWFSWLSKKDPNASTGGPIRAKLGEENSFYYDKELKRWVNKKDPNGAATTANSTPPPPKGPAPASRSASSTSAGPPLANNLPTSGSAPTLAPPPNPSSRSPSPAGDSSPRNFSPSIPSLAAPLSASPLPIQRSVSTGLPSRPGTALSNASSIDDLLGAPQARKGNTVRGKKKGRGYVDVMAK